MAIVAFTVKWQRWDSTAYNWFATGANDALPAMEAELSSWMSSVNANASNATQQLAIERGASSSLQANYGGLVLSAAASGTVEKGYLFYGCMGSTSAKRLYTGNSFDNGIGNGGYGVISGGASDTSTSWYTSGREANWLLIYDDTDGEEFFSFGPTFDSRSSGYEDGFLIYKRSDGTWVMVSGDGQANQLGIGYVNTSQFTGWTQPTRRSGNYIANTDRYSYFFERYSLYPNNYGSSTYIDTDVRWRAANPNLFSPPFNSTYYFTGDRLVLNDLGDGTNVYMISAYFGGPMVLVDGRA